MKTCDRGFALYKINVTYTPRFDVLKIPKERLRCLVLYFPRPMNDTIDIFLVPLDRVFCRSSCVDNLAAALFWKGDTIWPLSNMIFK